MSINIFENIHKQTIILSINSLLTSFSSSIILAINIVPAIGQVFNITESNFIAFRVLAESIGYFSKIPTGYISDIANNRKIFILAGYKVVVVLKTILLVFSYGFGSPELRCKVFNACNITDKLFNVMRDSVRDAHICDCVHEKYRTSNMSFRKNFSLIGNVIGLTFFSFMYTKINIHALFAISLMASIAGWLLLLFYLEEQDRYHFQENVKESHVDVTQEEEISIIKQVYNVLLERKSLFLLLLSCCVLFIGKVDDMLFINCYQQGNPRLLLNIIYACAPVLLSKFLFSYMINAPILSLFVCGILFSAYNTYFYMFLQHNYVSSSLLIGIIAVIIQGIYRIIIDPIFIGLVTGSKKVTPRIHGTVIGVVNSVIATGVGIRYIVGSKLTSNLKILLSSPTTSIGLGLLMLFAYFDNKKISTSSSKHNK